MKKIPTLFLRSHSEPALVIPMVEPGCVWVMLGKGVATRKYDGTCVAIIGGKYYKRRQVKPGKKAPGDFILAEHDERTGKSFGWVPVEEADKHHWEGYNNTDPGNLPDGTYELIGPKVQGNPEKQMWHYLMRHAAAEKLIDVPLDFYGLAGWLEAQDIEGIVWHHPDGRMAKIKKRDFGQER